MKSHGQCTLCTWNEQLDEGKDFGGGGCQGLIWYDEGEFWVTSFN